MYKPSFDECLFEDDHTNHFGCDCGGWTVLYPQLNCDGDTHVIPINDLRNHYTHEDCWCSPEMDPHSEELIWIHNSQDQREKYGPGTHYSN